MTLDKPLIYDLSSSLLEKEMVRIGQPRFRADQIWQAIYKTFLREPGEITTLPKNIREILNRNFSFHALEPLRTIESRDGKTNKTLFKLRDGNQIEAVLMFYEDRRTLCISSQSGCPIGCSFCATGQMGFKRNLTSGEIIAQVLYYARYLSDMGDHVTNVVVMGMGEPFLNYDQVIEAVNRLNHPKAFGLGARRFTISTVGLTPQIIRFADDGYQYNLAVSLHSVDDALRLQLIPINKKYPVDSLISACRYYLKKTNRRITFEYALIHGLNDSVRDAEALAEKINDLICHVNLIPLNPTRKYGEKGTNPDQVENFCAALKKHNISCTIRLRRGIEIQAGCGQLATESELGT